MSKIDSAFPWDAYKFLIKPLRDDDVNGMLERYTGALQQMFEVIQTDIHSIKDLKSAVDIPDEYLTYLKWHLGWTQETDNITDGLSNEDLRKLIAASVPMWKLKGTELGIKEFIRLLTGRDILIWNWFFTQWTLDVTGLWRKQQGSDPWLVGDQYGERDEYLMLIFISDETGIEKQLIHDLLELNRPVNETFYVTYAALVDDFRVGRAKWTLISGTDAVWDEVEFHLELAIDTRLRVNVDGSQDWDELFFVHAVRLTNNAQTYVIDFRVNGLNYYRLEFDVSPGSVTLTRVTSGVPVILATQLLGDVLSISGPLTLGFQVAKSCAGELRISGIVDAQEVIIATDPASTALEPGYTEVYSGGTHVSIIDNAIAMALPTHVDVVGYGLELTPEPDPVKPSPCIVREFGMAALPGWMITGNWHLTSFRYYDATNSLYFGAGEVGYHTWGTPGDNAPGTPSGTATTPPTDVSTYTADLYDIFVDFWQHVDIRSGPGVDDVRVIVVVSGVPVLTIGKPLINTGNGRKRYDITSVAAGQLDVKIRFLFDALSAGSTGEGWFVDNLRILAVEK